MSQLLWNGIFVGSFYALVALGYSMVYGIIKLLNFAHGDIYMLGAFAGFAMLSMAGGLATSAGFVALLVVLLISMLLTSTAGLLLERVAYRPLRGAPRLSVLITAVGASFAIEYGVSLAAGPNPEVYPVRLSGTAAQATAQAHKWLDFVNLRGDRHGLARHLPYGEQRRVEIARAHARGRKLLLLNEPAAGLPW